MAFARRSGPVMHSLRFRLPLFLTLYSAVVGLVLFTVANEIQEAAFESDFVRTELVRATEIQSRTERAAERSELETAQREFGELAVFEEIRAAVFVAPDNKVVLGSRRDWIGRPLDLTALGLTAAEHPRVDETMRSVRSNGRTESLALVAGARRRHETAVTALSRATKISCSTTVSSSNRKVHLGHGAFSNFTMRLDPSG